VGEGGQKHLLPKKPLFEVEVPQIPSFGGGLGKKDFRDLRGVGASRLEGRLMTVRGPGRGVRTKKEKKTFNRYVARLETGTSSLDSSQGRIRAFYGRMGGLLESGTFAVRKARG